jgi:hypothetical protein
MSSMKELELTTTQKAVSQKLNDLLTQQKVPAETREAILNSFEMMYEYIPYAIKQGENPSSGKVLAEFLATKGMKMAKYLGNNSVNCGIAIVELLKSGATAVQTSSSPAAAFLPAPVLAWGLATLDLIEVGNSCEFAQDAFYHAFLKESSYVVRRSESAAGNLNKLP